MSPCALSGIACLSTSRRVASARRSFDAGIRCEPATTAQRRWAVRLREFFLLLFMVSYLPAPWLTGMFGSVVRIVKSPKFAEFLPVYRGAERSTHCLPPAFSSLGVVPPIPRAVRAAVVTPNQPATPNAGRVLFRGAHVRCPDVGDPGCSVKRACRGSAEQRSPMLRPHRRPMRGPQ